MVLFCSAQEFASLCRDLSDRAQLLRFQAKGGSMYPFIRSGDWVDVVLRKGDKNGLRKGDIVLFSKDESLYLHRVLRRAKDGFLVKGDMSFGHDGLISEADILARVVSVDKGGRRINLLTGVNRIVGVIAAQVSLILQYPFLGVRSLGTCARAGFSRIQGFKVYRRMIRNILDCTVAIRQADERDDEQLRDLYLMSGRDIREGIIRIKNEGSWLVAERKQRIVAGLTLTRCREDPGIWLIFGLEVKPLLRGMGIGRKIASEAILLAKDSGAQRIGLFVNKKSLPALSLYRKLGFQVTDAFPAQFNRAGDELYLSYELAQ